MTNGVRVHRAPTPDGSLMLPDRRGWAAAAVTALLALGLLLFAASVAVAPPGPGIPYAPAFHGAQDGPAVMMNRHDGQAFGSLALDPLLAHPERWPDGAPALAYRASRPLLGWLVMLTSLGSSERAAWSLLVWTAIGIGLMAAGAAALCRRWGRAPDWLPLLLGLPGVIAQVLFPGLADGLAAGLALFGLAWWIDRRDRSAVAIFCLAALCRETTLVVPLALLLTAGWRRGRVLLVPFGAYLTWVGIVWLRVSALPSDATQGTLAVPLQGLIRAVPQWNWTAAVTALTLVVLGVAAYVRAPDRQIRAVVLVSAAFATTMPDLVWRSWDVMRPLLPVAVVGACLLAGKTRSTPSRSRSGESVPTPAM